MSTVKKKKVGRPKGSKNKISKGIHTIYVESARKSPRKVPRNRQIASQRDNLVEIITTLCELHARGIEIAPLKAILDLIVNQNK